MPSINSRMLRGNAADYETVEPVSPPPVHNLPFQTTSNSSSLMSITNGNSVPMRGILPIEQMSDFDLQRFFPYTAHYDRIPRYTYYALFNSHK